MKPQHVEVIAAIAENGSLAAAAAQLGKTQPAISSALRKAEVDLGAKLFERLPHGVVATSIGQQVVERCIKIQSDLKSIDETVTQSQGHFSGRLNIIATPVASIAILPKILRKYNRKYPDISLVVASGHTPPAFQELRNGGADFVLGPPPDGKTSGGFKSVEIVTSRILAITGKNSKHLHETDPAKLQQASWFDHGSPRRKPMFFGYFEDHDIKPPEPMICADSISCILSLVEDTDFLFCIPEVLFHRMKGDREFGVLPVTESIQPVTICLSSAKDKIQTPAAVAFSDMVQDMT